MGKWARGKFVAETKLPQGVLSPTWMTSAAKGVYSYAKNVISWGANHSGERRGCDFTQKYHLNLICMFIDDINVVITPRPHTPVTSCCSSLLSRYSLYLVSVYSITWRARVRQETRLRGRARMRFPSAWISLLFTAASQLIKLGNERRSKSSPVIAIKQGFIFPSGSSKPGDTQNKTRHEASLHGVHSMMLELKRLTMWW